MSAKQRRADVNVPPHVKAGNFVEAVPMSHGLFVNFSSSALAWSYGDFLGYSRPQCSLRLAFYHPDLTICEKVNAH